MKTIITIDNIHTDLGYPKFEYRTIIKYTGRTAISDLLGDRVYEPKPKDKIYFFSGCNVPRFKVKQFCEKYKVARVKFEERATAKFIFSFFIL